MQINWSKITLFEDLTEEEILQVKNIFSTIDVGADTNLITENTKGDKMFILIDGKVQIRKSMLFEELNISLPDIKSTTKVLATLEGSSHPIFGEIALVDDDIRSATVHVLTPSTFLETSQEKFFHFINKYPPIGVKLLLSLCKNFTKTIRKSNNEVVKITTALALSLSRTA
ncbi:MAG: family transcriptional regulator, cyclic receptor protein [Desulfovibrionales bacterium]|jgi:CRP-like cAMP-binding protein|nr:family transcriptional regulator, cyclic receptor protein [Desulfovibrionales bacterium]